MERYKPNTKPDKRPKQPDKSGRSQNRTLARARQKGDPKIAGSGRKKGTPNKVPALLREAVVMAARLEGSNRKGKGELVGFLRMASRTHKGNFLTLLGRVLPLQVNASIQGELTITEKFKGQDIKSMSLEEKIAAMRDMLNMTKPLQPALPAPDDDSVTEGEFIEVSEEENSEA